MNLAKMVVIALSLLGLADVACRLAVGKGSVSKIHEAVVKTWAHHKQHFEVPPMLQKAKECHMKCGTDKECHEKCPRPWGLFAKRCEKLKPIMECHQSCGRDFGCHERCPMPECPRMQAKVKGALQCHGACKEGDKKCHHQCPKPFLHMIEKCHHLHEVTACHKACGFGDHECHHKCGAHHGHHGHHGGHGWHHWLHHGHHGHHHEERAEEMEKMEKMEWMREHGLEKEWAEKKAEKKAWMEELMEVAKGRKEEIEAKAAEVAGVTAEPAMAAPAVDVLTVQV